MNNTQWTLLTIGGILFIVGYNFGLAIRDTKGINQAQQIEEIQYKQIPVIPFTNLQ